MLDTEPVLANGGGQISLRDETMSLRLKGKPKEFRLVRLILPVTVQGSLTAPKFGVEADKAVGQLGFAAALGAAVAPLAAILPFVDTGLAKDANCAALMNGNAPAGQVPLIAQDAKEKKRG